MPSISRLISSITGGASSVRAGEAPAGRDGIPTALKETDKRQAAEFTDATGKPITVSYDGRDMLFGSVDRARLPAGSFEPMLREMKSSRDAGNAVVVANNATLHTLTSCYGTHKPMEAWLTKVPADGKLSMHLIATPSTHAGSDETECQQNFDSFAKTNVYNLEIVFPDGTRELKRFDVQGQSPPEVGSSKPSPTKQTASASPEIVIDLNVWAGKGDIRIRGWADGSAGVGGYPEHRETVLHL
jgi:hypothetical protein